MSRAFVFREVEAISQDLHEIAVAMKTECDRMVAAVQENEELPIVNPIKGTCMRAMSDWEKFLLFEMERIDCLIKHMKNLG